MPYSVASAEISRLRGDLCAFWQLFQDISLMAIDSRKITELQHSLVQHHLSRLRAKHTPPSEFRQHVRMLSMLLVAEATRSVTLKPVTVETPNESTTCHELAGRFAAVPILRAGLGMVGPLEDLIPQLEVWHLGLYRDEATAQPVHYYDKLPSSNPPDIAFVLDPMLATGGSACMAIRALKQWGVPQILMLSIISAPEGIAKVQQEFSDVTVFTCAIDRCLNDRKYIVPGLGDAGDRIFNTV
jgi:uracil phosphoribosyltransferase